MSTSPHDPDLSPIGVRIEHQQIIFKPVMAFLLTPFEVGKPGALDVIPFVAGRFFCRCYPECYPVAFPPSAISALPIDFVGDPGGARTPNPLLRRQALYPVELRDHARSAGVDCYSVGEAGCRMLRGKVEVKGEGM